MKTAAFALLVLAISVANLSSADDKIDTARVKALYEKSKRGDKLTAEEQKYLDRGLQELKGGKDKKSEAAKGDEPKWKEQPSTGLIPLTDMGASAKYKGEDGGLYGGGSNEPPKAQQAAAREASKLITPLDAQGKPSPDGKIVLISLGMSNTAIEFVTFKAAADADPSKSPKVTVVNCAVGGAGVTSWTQGGSMTWTKSVDNLREAKVTPEQVQVAWIKHAEAMPDEDKVPLEYAKKIKKDIATALGITKAKFPNLRVAYLSSRIYGGYNVAGRRRVNPEPFAYETAFSARWVIQDQITGVAHNVDPKKGRVVAPVLLWGPYLWADGVNPRKTDGLTWERKDFGQDGVHPARETGARKVSDQLLKFFKNDENAKMWFVKE